MRRLMLVLLCAMCWGAMSMVGAADGGGSTRQAVERLMKSAEPRLAYDTTMTAEEFGPWRAQMGAEMARLMRHPEGGAVKEPVLVASAKRDGYTAERWISYPLEGYEVAFYVLVPDGIAAGEQRPAAMCIPGFGQTKELLAGERRGNFSLQGEPDSIQGKSAMALQYVRQGLVAVAVDNPCCGELADEGYFDYLASSRFLLELGWSYLGLASWQDRVILDWMKADGRIDRDRIILSGFSLGTEPMMALGLMDESIYAFVYNDFLCRTRERALTMNKPNERGERPFPNSIEHLIPEFLTSFDFPDIVCALAPRPVICTEGGMDRDFRIISKAFETAGAKDAFEYHHYAKFVDPASRVYLDEMPSGVDRTEFFRLANVDPPHHYFKTEHVMPWLHRLLK